MGATLVPPEHLFGNSKLGLLLALLLAGSMWFYVNHILVPYEVAEAAAHGRPRGNLSDLYPRWYGARELLLHHRDPYSPEVTREIQAGYYGRALDPARPNDPKDQQAFAYPVYVTFLLAPTLHLPFDVVQAGFRWFLLCLTTATVPLWLHAVRWRPSPSAATILLLLTLGSFPAVQGIKLQQLSLLVSGLLAGCGAALAAGYLVLAGVLLALATIKPQLVLPLAGWLMLWALSDWPRRKRLAWGFGLTMGLLLAGAQFLLPGWISRFRLALAAYRQYTKGGSVLDVLLPPGWGGPFSLLLLLALAVVCWRRRREPSDTPAFALTVALVLAVTVVVVPMFAPYNQLLLLPGVFVLVRSRKPLWERNRLTRSACVLAGLLVSWPWMAAVGLTTASLALQPASVQRGWAMPLYTSLGIPLVIGGALALLAVHPSHTTKSASAGSSPQGGS